MSSQLGENSLIPGENIVLRMRQHWIVLIRAAVTAALLTAALAWLEHAMHDGFPRHSPVIDQGIVLLYLGFLFPWSVVPFLRWLTTVYLFTDQRIITRTGLLRISGEAIPLAKINSVEFSKTLLERVLGSGSLTVESAAENQVLIRHVAGAEEVQKQIYTLMAALTK